MIFLLHNSAETNKRCNTGTPESEWSVRSIRKTSHFEMQNRKLPIPTLKIFWKTSIFSKLLAAEEKEHQQRSTTRFLFCFLLWRLILSLVFFKKNMWALISRGGLVLLFSGSQRLSGWADLNAAPALPVASALSLLPGGHGDWGCCRCRILKSSAMEVGWIQGLNVHSRCTVGGLTLG